MGFELLQKRKFRLEKFKKIPAAPRSFFFWKDEKSILFQKIILSFYTFFIFIQP